MKFTLILVLSCVVPGAVFAWLGDYFQNRALMLLGIWWFASFFVAWPLCVIISKIKARVRNY